MDLLTQEDASIISTYPPSLKVFRGKFQFSLSIATIQVSVGGGVALKLIYTCSVFYMSLGLAMGVFYREYTKYLNFTGKTTLSTLHVHALVLGALFFILLMILERQVSLTAIKKFSLWLLLYNIALLGVLATLTIRGLLQVHGTDISGLNHIAGTFHTLFGFTWIWFLLMLKKAFKV